MNHLEKEIGLVGFSCRNMTIFDLFDPRYFSTLERIQLLDAEQDAVLVNYGFCLPPTPQEIRRHGYYNSMGSAIERVGVAFVPPVAVVKVIMTTGRYGLGRRLLLLNGAPDMPGGHGLGAAQHARLAPGAWRVAGDIFWLNAARLDNLERHGIHSGLLRRLHTKTDSLLQAANGALGARNYRTFEDLSRRAWSYALRT